MANLGPMVKNDIPMKIYDNNDSLVSELDKVKSFKICKVYKEDIYITKSQKIKNTIWDKTVFVAIGAAFWQFIFLGISSGCEIPLR